MNKLLAMAFILIIFCRCGHPMKEKDSDRFVKNIRFKKGAISEQNLFDTLEQLSNKKQYRGAHKLMDSLILMNEKNGLLYYDRAGVEMREEGFKSALSDLKTAMNLNYDKAKCLESIEFCQQSINEKNQ